MDRPIYNFIELTELAMAEAVGRDGSGEVSVN